MRNALEIGQEKIDRVSQKEADPVRKPDSPVPRGTELIPRRASDVHIYVAAERAGAEKSPRLAVCPRRGTKARCLRVPRRSTTFRSDATALRLVSAGEGCSVSDRD